MKKYSVFFVLLILTIIGGFLRFYKNINNPVSLNIDEVAYGYSAYSILKTARDENGIFMPLNFPSVGDYKSPILIYSLVPVIALFGLNEFSVRFTTGLAGLLSIPVFFFLLRTLTKNIKISLIGTMLLAISPWHIFFSRFASESLMSIFFLIIGMWFLLKTIEGGKLWPMGASIAFVLSMYTYHSQRLFIPIFLLFFLTFNIKKVKAKKTNVVIFILITTLLTIPLAYNTLFGSANTRAGMVFLSQDIDYTRYIIIDHTQRLGENLLLFFFWIQRYLNYFQPDFLFFTGLNMTISGSLGAGVLYLFELPTLILGIVKLIRNEVPNRYIIVLWILIGIIPASLTNNEQSAVRSLTILPAIIILNAIGLFVLINFIFSIKKTSVKIGAGFIYLTLVAVFLIQTFLVFAVHFPQERGEAFMEGTKESVLYAINNKDKYQEIVYDPNRGIEAPYIVNIPYMYILFYSKYNPAIFQKEIKRSNENLFGFDKFTIRPINWRVDRFKKNTLFIGSPWSLPLKDIPESNILRKIYLSGGQLALLIVSPD